MAEHRDDEPQDDIAESPTDPTGNGSTHNRNHYQSYEDRTLEPRSQAVRLKGNQYGRLQDDDVIQAPRKSYSQETRPEVEEDFDIYETTSLPVASPYLQAQGIDSVMKYSDSPERSAKVSFSLDTRLDRTTSFEERIPKVSFSEDVEEHYYVDDAENDDTENDDGEVRKADPVEGLSLAKIATTTPNAAKHEDGYLSPDEDWTSKEKNDRDELYSSDGSSSTFDDLLEEEACEDVSPALEQLANALSLGLPLPEDWETTLVENPNFASSKLLPGTDRLPLHAACIREFPNRFSDGDTCIVHDLVSDISNHQNLIRAIAESNTDACSRQDDQLDLPVHLLARHLMEWEANWYQKVYEKAQHEDANDGGNAAAITKLYQTMSQSIDLLLQPIMTNKVLCRKEGSVGRLLPLHIAAIFTVSYNTLKTLLEEYPKAATIPCDLSEINTFIPSDSLPLELHDRLSTDFPKWEIENVDGESKREINWSQSTLDKSYGTKDCIRRSDLMFAYNPNVTPYRHDTPRIRRIEARIRQEVTAMAQEDDLILSNAARLLWIWMCTFIGASEDDTYVDSVNRVVQALPHQSVLRLAAVITENLNTVLDEANEKCAEVILRRLDEIAENEVPIPMAEFSSGYRTYREASPLLGKWEDDMAQRLCLQGRGFVGVLCRTLFNIMETKFPTTFVFLPYKLVRDETGRLGLDSPAAAAVAVKFADCLTELTTPERILHFLEKKHLRFVGQSLGGESDKEWFETEDIIKQQVDKLLKLYGKGPAYFYFLDEFTGIPIVPEKKGLYPLVVNDPVDMVRKVLPMMLTGMILMRGEKAISILSKIILNPHIKTVQKNWIEAAKDIVGYLFSPQTEWTASFLQDLLPLRDGLIDFIDRGTSESAIERDPNSLTSEWVVEISLVRMLVEMHDSKHSYAGLKPRTAHKKVLWTMEEYFLDRNNPVHLFYYDFKSTLELKETSSEAEDVELNALDTSDPEEHHLSFTCIDQKGSDTISESSSVVSDAYGPLFGDLALPVDNDESKGSENVESIVHWSTPKPSYLATPRHASASVPISLLNFDDSLDLDDVLQLRIQLDEQEAKLEFLKEKIMDIQREEIDLIEQEDKLGQALDEIINKKDQLLVTDSNGLCNARKLLLRICDLEERVLCREIEVQQLKMDITAFEIEAENEAFDSITDDIVY